MIRILDEAVMHAVRRAHRLAEGMINRWRNDFIARADKVMLRNMGQRGRDIRRLYAVGIEFLFQFRIDKVRRQIAGHGADAGDILALRAERGRDVRAASRHFTVHQLTLTTA